MKKDELSDRVSLFSRFFDLIHQPITIIDSDARFIYYNQESADIDGYSVQAALGKTHNEVYGIPEEKSTMLRALYDGTEFTGNHQVYYNRKGKAVEFQHTTVPLRAGSGEILGVIEIGRDLSLTRLLQEQVVELNNLLYSHTQHKQTYEIITADPGMKKKIAQARRMAASDMPVMIVGETGTGKELLARLVHTASPRSAGPFIALNCAAIPEPLLESTLFGTEAGAFTGAENRKGYLELAANGTLFLDELSAMPVSLQSKLLRFCQDNTFWKVGGTRQLTSDIRLISALNVSPSRLIGSGQLRADLYYRLCVGYLTVPPLTSRPGDIVLLAEHFVRKYRGRVICNISGVSKKCAEHLRTLSWPGNVRMLENVIVRSMLQQEHDGLLDAVAGDDAVSPQKPLPEPGAGKKAGAGPAVRNGSLEETLAGVERQLITDALNATNGNISLAADKLHIPRATLYYKVKKLGLTFCVRTRI